MLFNGYMHVWRTRMSDCQSRHANFACFPLSEKEEKKVEELGKQVQIVEEHDESGKMIFHQNPPPTLSTCLPDDRLA